MKDPNYQKLENLIHRMVDDRVYEGQLSKTPLTFQDLRVIKETFLNILVGIYHSRVEYPEDKKDKPKASGKKKQTDQSPQHKETDDTTTSPKVDDYYNS